MEGRGKRKEGKGKREEGREIKQEWQVDEQREKNGQPAFLITDASHRNCPSHVWDIGLGDLVRHALGTTRACWMVHACTYAYKVLQGLLGGCGILH